MNRIDYILKFTKDKRVIDIGGIDHDASRISDEKWLHKKIADSASYVLGVDLAEDEVKKAKKLGYNFIYGNAENLEEYVDEEFDVCVAGELIEHVANPGLFLQSVKSVLGEAGRLILTTPNAFSFGNIVRILKYTFRLSVPPDNFEHKAWYDLFTLEQLLKSQGFEVEEIFTIRPDREKSLLNNLKHVLYGNANSKILCVARKQKSS